MGFTIEAGREKKEEHAISGKYQKVAVDCWFTSTGRVMPKLIKYMDEEGCLQTLRDIRIIKRDQKHYAGVYCQRFDCKVVVEGREQCFTLLFHPGESVWDMVTEA